MAYHFGQLRAPVTLRTLSQSDLSNHSTFPASGPDLLQFYIWGLKLIGFVV